MDFRDRLAWFKILFWKIYYRFRRKFWPLRSKTRSIDDVMFYDTAFILKFMIALLVIVMIFRALGLIVETWRILFPKPKWFPMTPL